MAERSVSKMVRGQKAIDGAGVHLVRVLGHDTVEDYDPFLMLDSFDSTNPDDYTKGFPFHPHRGIETITYLIEGEIEHRDSLGNKGVIRGGQSQWMTAGSGIMHQEMPQASPRMLGMQLWLNLPKEEKMAEPRYFDITQEMIGEKQVEGGVVRVVSGAYEGVEGARPHHIAATIYDVTAEAGKSVTLPVKAGDNVFVFLIEGDAVIGGDTVPEKTAVLFGREGDSVTVGGTPSAPARFIYCAGRPLAEPISWGGPIVMNTRAELQQAFDELREDSFIKHKPAGI